MITGLLRASKVQYNRYSTHVYDLTPLPYRKALFASEYNKCSYMLSQYIYKEYLHSTLLFYTRHSFMDLLKFNSRFHQDHVHFIMPFYKTTATVQALNSFKLMSLVSTEARQPTPSRHKQYITNFITFVVKSKIY